MSRHSRSVLFVLAILLVLQAIGPSMALTARAANDRGDRLQQAVHSAGVTTYDRNSQAYLQRALDALTPLAMSQPGKGFSSDAIAALRADIPAAFFDVSRVHTAASLDRTLALVRETGSAWTSGATSDPAALVALADLLLEMRQAAEAATTDAGLIFSGDNGPPDLPGIDPGTWQAAVNQFRQAEQAMSTAFAQAAQGNASSTGQHFLLAWRQATDALSAVGVVFLPGQTTDIDGDGVPDQLEVRLGASPILKDTDGDGLTDFFEIRLGGATFLPAAADTDNNGTGDAAEDSDGDELTNVEEQALGTDPLRADTDDDGLRDGQEVAQGSDPRAPDVDQDGLSDPAEMRVGTDPRNPDTDGDGTLDGQETLIGTVESSAGRVEITGVGDVAGTVRIRSMDDVPAYQGLAGLASAVTEITAARPFTSARVELPVDLSKVPGGDTANLQLMYYDTTANQWRPVEGAQGFDAASGRFWGVTTHFTAFAVFYIPDWDDFWTVEVCGVENPEAPQFIDVALVLDSSGSMSTNDPQGLRREGARRLVRGLLEQDRAAIVDFDGSARVWQAMTSDKAALETAINRVDSSGGTNIGAGVNLGLGQLGTGATERGRIMVLLTDGVGSYSDIYTTRAIEANVVIYTIGLGNSIDQGLLQEIASRTGGKYYHVLKAEDLPAVFERVSDEVGVRDSDHDTLANCDEIEGMTSLFGKMYTSDPNDVDSDGDGLLDNEEMGILFGAPNEPVGYVVQSDPMSFDTDGDGLDDAAELANGTPRMIPDWDGDGLNDYQELLRGTVPDVDDSDGDSFSDDYEVDHISDGFDPLVVDEAMTPDEWARDYSDGVKAGDGCGTWLGLGPECKGTIPFFLGQLTGGTTSFIPIVGWVVGGIFDLRDAIGNAIKGEWVGAGLSVVGILPYAGDVIKLAGKVADFVSKYGKLEPLLRAVLRSLPRLLPDGGSNTARDLVLEVMKKVDPAGFDTMSRFGNNEFLVKLATMGAKWEDLGKLFAGLEARGLFSDYPRMKGFVEQMIRETPDDVLNGAGDVLTLNSRVTLNIKKAATRTGDDLDKYLETLGNHLKGALAENATLAKIPGDEDLIKVGHITAVGPDRVVRTGNVVDVLEVKALSPVGHSTIKKWLIKRVDDDGKTIYEFNGVALDRHLQAAGQPDLQSLLATNTLRYNIFVYDQGASLTGELAGLVGTRIPIKGVNGAQIELTWTSHWEP